MPHQIKFTSAAKRSLRRLPNKLRTSIQNIIDLLAENPFPGGVKKLQGRRNQYRIRHGAYRIIYSIENEQLVILILHIGDRRDVYKKRS